MLRYPSYFRVGLFGAVGVGLIGFAIWQFGYPWTDVSGTSAGMIVMGMIFLWGAAVMVTRLRRQEWVRVMADAPPPDPKRLSDHGIPQIDDGGVGLLMGGVVALMVLGLLLKPWGLILTAAGAGLWWHGQRAGWLKQKVSRLHLLNAPVRIGGELQAEIAISGGLAPTGGGTVFLWCEQRTLREQLDPQDSPARLEVIELNARQTHFVLDDAWRHTDDGICMSIRMPVSGGEPSHGVADPRQAGESGVVWILDLQVPLEKDRFGAKFYVPVAE